MRQRVLLWIMCVTLPGLSLAKSSLPLNSCHELAAALDTLIRIETRDEPQKHLVQAAALAQQAIAQNCPQTVDHYNLLGYLFYNQSDLATAKQFLLAAETIYLSEAQPFRNAYAQNQHYLGLIDILEREFVTADMHFAQVKEAALSLQDSTLLREAYLSSGLSLLEQGRYLEAKDELKKSLQLAEEVPSYEQTGFAYHNLSRVYYHLDDLPTAFEYADRAKNHWLEHNFHKGLYLLSLQEADLFIVREAYTEALDRLQQGLYHAQQGDLKIKLGDYYRKEGSIYALQNNQPAEIEALENALRYSVEFDSPRIQKIALRLQTLYEQQGQLQNPLNNLLLEIIRERELNRAWDNQRSFLNEGKLAQKIEQNESLEQNNLDGKLTIERQSALIIILLGLFSLALISLLFYHWANQRNKALITQIQAEKEKTERLNDQLLLSQQTIKAQIQALESKNKELTSFAYTASHDLKSPLRNITSFAGLLQRKLQATDPSMEEYLQIIIDSGKNMQLLIADLLEHAASDLNINMEVHNFTQLAELAIFNLKSTFDTQQISIQLTEEPSYLLKCDGPKLTRVLQNLIQNAINYAQEEKPVQIEVAIEEQAEDYLVSVADNGIGIEVAYQEQIFEAFRRLHVKPEAKGTGIGLAICKKIIQLHGGQIWVESTPGEGSTFFFSLPKQ